MTLAINAIKRELIMYMGSSVSNLLWVLTTVIKVYGKVWNKPHSEVIMSMVGVVSPTLSQYHNASHL